MAWAQRVWTVDRSIVLSGFCTHVEYVCIYAPFAGMLPSNKTQRYSSRYKYMVLVARSIYGAYIWGQTRDERYSSCCCRSPLFRALPLFRYSGTTAMLLPLLPPPIRLIVPLLRKGFDVHTIEAEATAVVHTYLGPR